MNFSKKINFILVLIYFIAKQIYADSIYGMVVDYFTYKKVSSVVGFSCRNDTDSKLLIDQFSRINIKSAIYRNGNESIVTKIKSDGQSIVGIFLETECYSSSIISLIYSEATEYRMFDDLHNWFVIGGDLNKILKDVEDEAFGLSTDFVVAIADDFGNFELYDVYNPFKLRGTKLNVTRLGRWNYEKSLAVNWMQPKSIRRANLNGVILKIIFNKPPYRTENESLIEYLEDQVHPERDAVSRFGYQMMKYVADIFNFSFISSESPSWKPGDKLGPVARKLVENVADIAGSPMTITRPRLNFLKFVHEDWFIRTCFIFRNPQLSGLKAQEILKPLDDTVWYLLVITLVLGFSILSMVLRFECSDLNRLRLSNSFIIAVGALCQQGTDIKMKQISSRVAFLSVLFFSLLIYDFYSASIVSARLDEQIYKINDSLNELRKLNLKMASEWMSYLPVFLQQQDWETKQFYETWLKIKESDRYLDAGNGIKLVKEGGFAYHVHADVAYRFIENTFNNREICELMEVHLGRRYTSFGVRINSSIVEIMRIGLAKIAEVGLQKRTKLKHQYRKPRCRADILSASSITIEEFASHLILLTIGFISAVLIFTVEVIVMRARTFEMTNCKIISYRRKIVVRKLIQIARRSDKRPKNQ